MQKFDEMYTATALRVLHKGAKQIRDHYKIYDEWLARQPGDMMAKRREEAEMIFRRVGITFAVYGAKDEDGAGTERLIPFDLIPRIIPAHEWASMEKGLVQRVTALNRFIHDVYHDQEIIKAGLIPAEQILKKRAVPPEMVGVDVPAATVLAHLGRRHRAGTQCPGRRRVLRAGRQPARAQRRELHAGRPQDDDAAVPGPVQRAPVAPVAHYPDLLLETLRASSPATTPSRRWWC
jgi:uncharacterized circularly permuted ATP-grasp superfamily protein